MIKHRSSAILQFRPRADDLQTRIRDLACADTNVYLGTESRRRLFQLGASRLDVVHLIQEGFLVERSVQCVEAGQFECLLVGSLLGVAEVTSVIIRFDGSNIFVLKILQG